MKLVMFIAAEKTIADAQGVASIISIFQAFKIVAMPGQVEASIPPDAVAPKEWSLNAMWALNEEHQDKNFIQQFQIYWPDGREFAKQAIPFLAKGETAMIYANINAIPVGLAGSLRMKAWVEDQSGKHLSEAAEFSVTVQH